MASIEDCPVMMPQGDAETIRTLFQQRPELWNDFKTLMELTDCLNEEPRDYNKLWVLLNTISYGILEESEKVVEDFCRFATALRFAEKSVDFMRQTMLRKGLKFITQFTFPDVESECLYMLRSLFITLSYNGREFATQLAKTGVLKDLMEDLKHMPDQSAQQLVKSGVFRINVCIVINCCRPSEGLAIVRAMNIKNNFVPFLSKDAPEIRAFALSALSLLVENEELDLMKLDRGVLQFLLRRIYVAVKCKRESDIGWTLEEVLFFLSKFARNDYNKRLILRTGGLETLGMVLVTRTKVEQEYAMKLLTQLAEEPEGKLLIRADASLFTILSKLESGDNRIFQKQATDLLMTIHEKSATPGQQEILTLLKDRVNTLAILDTSELGLVLCQLQVLATGGSQNPKDFSAIQLLKILSNIVKGDKRGQQIIHEGGLDTLCCYLKKGEDAEKSLVLSIVLDIMSDTEVFTFVRNNQVLLALLDKIRGSENEEFSQKAKLIWQTIH